MRPNFALAFLLLVAARPVHAFTNAEMVAKWARTYLQDKAASSNAEPVLSTDGYRFRSYTQGVIDSNYGTGFCPGSGVSQEEQIDFVAQMMVRDLEWGRGSPGPMGGEGLGLEGYLPGATVEMRLLSLSWPCRS